MTATYNIYLVTDAIPLRSFLPIRVHAVMDQLAGTLGYNDIGELSFGELSFGELMTYT